MEENAIWTYLRDTIRVSDVAGYTPSDRRIDVQNEGLIDITDFLDFYKEGLKSLYNSVR